MIQLVALAGGSTELPPAKQGALGLPSTGLSDPSVVKRSSLPPPMRELAVIEESLQMTQSVWGMTIMGEVRNDNDVTVSTPFVEIAVLDQQGSLFRTGTAEGVGFQPETPTWSNQWDILPEGEASWFTCHLPVPDSIEISEVRIRALSYETNLVPAVVPLEMVGEWRIDHGQLRADIENTSGVDLVGVAANIAIRTTDGVLIGTTVAAPRGETIGGIGGGLRAGEQTEITSFLSFDPDILATAEIETRLVGRAYEGSSHWYGIVGVAHRHGLGGSLWRSSISLTNTSGATGNVLLSFRQEESRVDVDVVIPDQASVSWSDVTRSLFGINGSAAGYIQIASDVPLAITARTFNSTLNGDYGQALPIFTPADTTNLQSLGVGVMSLIGGADQFRTNIGLVNMSDASCRVGVRLFGPAGDPVLDLGSVQLPPTSWLQVNDAAPGGTDIAYATVEQVDGCSLWAYASVVDNTSGDPTTVEVVPAKEVWLPGSIRPLGGFAIGGGWSE